MSNIYNTNVNIVNTPKLIEELGGLSLSGSIFDFCINRGTSLEAHYTENLSQAQVDEIANHINNFVEVSVLDNETEVTKIKQNAGWQVYQKIIADINVNGGLGTLDAGLAAYPSLFSIRNMLKDGFSEYALRHIVTVIEPAQMFLQPQIDQYKLWIRDHAKTYNGTPDAVLDMIEDPNTPV